MGSLELCNKLDLIYIKYPRDYSLIYQFEQLYETKNQ